MSDHPEVWRALETGDVDAYASDEALLLGLISRAKHPEHYEVVGRALSYEPYGIMVRHGDSAMRWLGNTALTQLMSSGEIFKIYDKWFLLGPTSLRISLGEMLKHSFFIHAFQ